MSEQGGTVSSADCRSEANGQSTITEYPGKSVATVHWRIAFACTNDVTEKLLDQISRTLQKAAASDVSVAVSISPEAFRPTNVARTSASWTAPSNGGDE